MMHTIKINREKQMQHLASHICPLLTGGDGIFSVGLVLAILQCLEGNGAWRNPEKRVSPVLSH